MTGMDTGRHRRRFGHLATVTKVVTGCLEEATCGVAVGVYVSVSLDPPLALIEGNTFTVNLSLGDQNEELASRFAGRPGRRVGRRRARAAALGVCRVDRVHTSALSTPCRTYGRHGSVRAARFDRTFRLGRQAKTIRASIGYTRATRRRRNRACRRASRPPGRNRPVQGPVPRRATCTQKACVTGVGYRPAASASRTLPSISFSARGGCHEFD